MLRRPKNEENKELQKTDAFSKEVQELEKAGLITDKEFDGYAPEKPLLVFCQIRQKDQKDEKGNIIQKAGKIKFNDGRPDIESLQGIILMTQAGRVYFENVGDTQPKCKSLNGITSIYGDKCIDCPHFVFHKDGSAPDCKALRNLLFLLEGEKNEPIIFTIGPSGLKHWRNFFAEWAKRKIPPHYLEVSISSEFMQDKGEYYIPVFEVKRILKPEEIKTIKQERDKLLPFFGATVEKGEIQIEEEEVKLSVEDMKKEVIDKISILDDNTQKEIYKLLAEGKITEAYNLLKSKEV